MYRLKVGDATLDFGPGADAAVMAIVNLTPDSFFEGSRSQSDDQIRHSVQQAAQQGALIIDIGGYSSRPGAEHITTREEVRRLAGGFALLREVAPQAVVSVDTFRGEVVHRLYDEFGPFVVNDIGGGGLCADMIPTVARLGLPYIAMHMRGTPATMNTLTHYDDLVGEVKEALRSVAVAASEAGIEQLVLDPGFGFAKSVSQNFELLRRMDELSDLGYPILAGLSRKSMIWRTLNITPEQALPGTAMLNFEALGHGASILRVHDTDVGVQAVKLFGALHAAS